MFCQRKVEVGRRSEPHQKDSLKRWWGSLRSTHPTQKKSYTAAFSKARGPAWRIASLAAPAY